MLWLYGCSESGAGIGTTTGGGGSGGGAKIRVRNESTKFLCKKIMPTLD